MTQHGSILASGRGGIPVIREVLLSSDCLSLALDYHVIPLRHLIAAAGAFAFVLAALTPARAADPIVIGVAGPMSGDLSRFGQQMQQGAERAVADVNANGGALGRPLKLVSEDDRCVPEHASAAANDLVDAGAVFVAGHFCSGSSIPASKVYHAHGILQITPASSNPRLTDEAAEAGWDTVFRIYGRDDGQAAFLGTWIATKFPGRPVAVVTDGGRYSTEMSRSAREAMAAKGVSPALEDSIAPGMTDYSDLVADLKSKSIGVVYFAGYYPEAGVIARQLHASGLAIQLVGSDALDDDEFLAAAGSSAEAVSFSAQADATQLPAATTLVAQFQSAGIRPTDYAIRTYAAIRLWADAAAKAGSIDAEKIAAVLHQGSWNTVAGALSFDSKGDPTTPQYAIYTVTNGKIVENK